MNETRQGETQPSFWTLVVFGIGVLWLFRNFDKIVKAIFYLLRRLWPLAMVGAWLGYLYLLFQRREPPKHATFSEPVGSARAARLELNTSVGETTIRALGADSESLIEADLVYFGSIAFEASGEEEKIVRLSPVFDTWQSLNVFNWLGTKRARLRWDIGLSPRVDATLDVKGGVGRFELDLRGLRLRGLNFSAGIGETTLQLPTPEQSYTATVKGGIGAMRIEVPQGAAVRLEATIGLGDVNVAPRLMRVEGEGVPMGKQGVWETADFASAGQQIVIRYEGGIGELQVR